MHFIYDNCPDISENLAQVDSLAHG